MNCGGEEKPPAPCYPYKTTIRLLGAARGPSVNEMVEAEAGDQGEGKSDEKERWRRTRSAIPSLARRTMQQPAPARDAR